MRQADFNLKLLMQRFLGSILLCLGGLEAKVACTERTSGPCGLLEDLVMIAELIGCLPLFVG